MPIEFTTPSTIYTIELSEDDLGTYVVSREPRESGPRSNVGILTLEADRVTVHPAEEGLHLGQARRVVFWKHGRAILITGYADQRAWLRGFEELPYEAIPLGFRHATKAEGRRPVVRTPFVEHYAGKYA